MRPSVHHRVFRSAFGQRLAANRSFLGTNLRRDKLHHRRVFERASLITKALDTERVLFDVRSIIAEQLAAPLEDVQPNSKFVDLGADSLDTVEIMMALEEKFELHLDENGAEKISTVQVISQSSSPKPQK